MIRRLQLYIINTPAAANNIIYSEPHKVKVVIEPSNS